MDTKVKQPEVTAKQAQRSGIPENIPVSLLRILKIAIIGFLVIGSCVVIFLQVVEWMKNSPVFALKKIRVEGNYALTRQEIVALLTIPEKPHLLGLPMENYRRQVIINPWVRRAAISREFPATLAIEVEEREPVAMILGKSTYYIDAEGYILPQPRSIRVFDVPCIVNIQDIGGVPGDKTGNADLMEAMHLLERLREADRGFWFNISEFFWEKGESFVIHLYDFAIPIRIPKEGELTDRLYILNYFLNYLHDEEKLKDISLIDLSYAGQLIVQSRDKKPLKK